MAYQYSYTTFPNFTYSSTNNTSRTNSLGYIDPNKTLTFGDGTTHNADSWKNLSFSYSGNFMTQSQFLGSLGSNIVSDSNSGFIATARIKQDTTTADTYSVTRRHITYEGNLLRRYDITFTIGGSDVTYSDPCPNTIITSDTLGIYLIASYVSGYSETFPAVRIVSVTDGGICYIGPVINNNIVKSILGTIEDEDVPEQAEDPYYPPKYAPEEAWSATSPDFENEFKIMAIKNDPTESQYWFKTCGVNYQTLASNVENMAIFGKYVQGYTGASRTEFLTSYGESIKSIHEQNSELGSSLQLYETDGTKLRFVYGNTYIDGSITYSQFKLSTKSNFTVTKGELGTLKITFTADPTTTPVNITGVTIQTTTSTYGTETYTYSGPVPYIADTFPSEFCIAKMGDDNFYLVGYIGESSGSFGFSGYSTAVFCVIDQIPLDGLGVLFPYSTTEEENPDSEQITEDILDEMGLNPIIDDEEWNDHDGDFGSGTGDPFKDDEEIDDPYDDLPDSSESYGAIGMFEVYAPTVAQLNDFGTELNSNSVLNILKDYFRTNPMDGIMGLYMLPYSGVAGSVTKQPCIGTYPFDTALNLADTDFLNVDYGSLNIECVYDDSWLDFAPNTDVKIYLPFIGYKEIDIGAIMNCTISLKYNINVLTGDILAYLYSKYKTGSNHLLYQWQGNCALRLPLTHTDFSSTVSAGISAVSGIATGVAGVVTGSAGMAVGALGSIASNAGQGWKPKISTSGNITGSAGFMGSRTPYLIFSRPILVKKVGDDDTEGSYKHEYGKPLGTTYYVSDMTGFTAIKNLDTSGIPATEDERNEIKSLFESGVWI